jgi:hypothetical protein
MNVSANWKHCDTSFLDDFEHNNPKSTGSISMEKQSIVISNLSTQRKPIQKVTEYIWFIVTESRIILQIFRVL